MKKPLMIAAMLLLAFSTIVFADIAPPTTPKPTPKQKAAKEIDTFLTIRMDEQYKEAKLLIPRKQLKQLRAELEQLDNESEDNTASLTENGSKNTQTVMAGMFLSLAFVFGGVWMFRSKAAKNTKIAGALLLVSLSGAAGTYVYANIGPPLEARSITSRTFAKGLTNYRYGSGRIKLALTDEQAPELQVPLIKEEPKPEE